MKTYLEWAEHIIKRFGGVKALKFVFSKFNCPCMLFEWDCKTCKYGRKPPRTPDCPESHEWHRLNRDFLFFSNRRIIKRIKKIKIIIGEILT